MRVGVIDIEVVGLIEILGVLVGVIDIEGVTDGELVIEGLGVGEGQVVVESTTAYPVIDCSLIVATAPFLST